MKFLVLASCLALLGCASGSLIRVSQSTGLVRKALLLRTPHKQ